MRVALRTSSASISAGVGIAVLHMSARRHDRAGDVPALDRLEGRDPAHEAGGEGSREGIAGTDPAQDLDGDARQMPSPRLVDQGDPGRAVLEDDRRRPAAGRDDRDEAGRGELVVAPDQHVAQLGGPSREAWRLAGSAHRLGRQSRSRIVVDAARRPRVARRSLEDPEGRGSGRLLGQQRRRHDRQGAVASSSAGTSSKVRRVSAAGSAGRT